LGSPVTDDNCGVATVTNNALAVYVVGTNVVTWTVTDASGNTNSGQQRVIVRDSQPPSVTWYRTNVVVVASTNCQALMPDITDTNYFLATDDCSPVIVTQSVAANTVLAAGTNEVVLAAFDLSGNAAYCTNYVVVVAPPVILSGPSDQTVPLGQEVTFCLSATNDCGGDLTYQWRFQGVELAGATSNCCTFTVLRLTNAGSYDVVVANLAAAVTSPAAVLTVVGPYLTVQSVEPSSMSGGRTNFMFTFPSVAGVDYVVEYQDVLTDSNGWLPLVTNSGTGGLITNDFPITADSPSRFYRILLP